MGIERDGILKKRLRCVLSFACLAAVLMTTSLVGLAEEAPEILPFTVGTEETGSLAEDAFSQSMDEGTLFAVCGRVSLEKNRQYDLEMAVTLTEESDSMVLTTLLCATDWLENGEPDSETMEIIGGNANAATDTDALSLRSSLFIEEAGEYLLVCAVMVPNPQAAGEYRLLVTDKGAVEQLKPAWNGSALNAYSALAAAPDGTLYVATGYSEMDLADPDAGEGDLDDGYYLVALNPQDGAEKWRFELAAASDGTPLVGPDGTIYIGTYADEDGTSHVYAVKPDGTVKWTRAFTNTDPDKRGDFWYSSALYNDKLLVKSDSALFALEAATGKDSWKAEAELYNFAYANPVIAGGHVYVAAWKDADTIFETGILLAYDLESGDRAFTLEDLELGPNVCTMAADGDGMLYYLSSDAPEVSAEYTPSNPLYAVAPDGTVKWTASTGLVTYQHFPLLVSKGVLYTAGMSMDTLTYRLLTFDAKTGKALDSVDLPLLQGPLSGMVLAENGDIYLAADNGLLCRRADGSLAWYAHPIGTDMTGAVTPMLLTKDGKLCLSYGDSLGSESPGSQLLCFDIGVGYADGWSMYFANPARQNAFTGNYKVSFESNGGTAVAPQWLDINAVVSKPANPTKQGSVFTGWFTDKELTNPYDFSAKVTSSFTLYAKWETVATTTAPNSTTAPTATKPSGSTATQPDTTSNPKTGPSSAMAGLASMLLITGGALTVVSRKRH